MVSLGVLISISALAYDPARADDPHFVRGGIAVAQKLAASNSIEIQQAGKPIEFRRYPLTTQIELLEFNWQPSTEYDLLTPTKRFKLRSPLRPAPFVLHKVELENVTQAALAGTSPDAVVRFSPDGRQIAIGTFGGWLRILDCVSGKTLHQQRIAEGMVKQLAWSGDGRQLYVGEQSPDGSLWCLATEARNGDEPGVYRHRWSESLARQLETSRPPANDRFGIYSLPCVFDLKIIADSGDLLVAGVHSWSENGTLRNRSTLSRYRADGSLAWRLPQVGAWPLVVGHAAVDAAGRHLLMLASQSQLPTGDEPLRTDTLYLLDGRNGAIADEYRIAPLVPHFSRVYTWDSLAIDAAGNRAAIGLADGRGLLFDISEGRLKLLRDFDLGTPIMVGNTPVAASASYTRIWGDSVCFQTQNTHIPFGNPQAALRAPSLHRGANTLTVADLDGVVQWRYRGPFALSGSWRAGSLRGTGGPLIVACRELPGAAEAGQYGVLLFDPRRSKGGSERLSYYYPTAGPVLFNADISADGRVLAVVEVPVPTPDGRETFGQHVLHLVH